jgi:hypothetical protein
VERFVFAVFVAVCLLGDSEKKMKKTHENPIDDNNLPCSFGFYQIWLSRAGIHKLHGKDLTMRSIKLLVATALLAALVAGPVMAQDAMGSAPAADTTAAAPAKTAKHKKHSGKHHKKAAAPAAAAPAAQ